MFTPDTTSKSMIFLAFANDRDDTVGYLRNLLDEARRLSDVRELAERAGLCEVVLRTNYTAGETIPRAREINDRVATDFSRRLC